MSDFLKHASDASGGAESAVHADKQATSWSRRKMLTAFGLTGVSLAVAGVARGLTASADSSSGVTASVYGGMGPEPILDLLGDRIVRRSSLAELRALTVAEPDAIYFVSDYMREGHFYYDPADTASPDNMGTIIVSSGGARFKRIVSNRIVNVQWFGAVGDGGTDDAPAIQAAIDAIPSEGGTLFFPPTSAFYALETSGLVVENRHNITISGFGATVKFKAGVPDIQNTNMRFSNFLLRNCRRIRIEGLIVHGNLSGRTAHAGAESFHSAISLLGCANVHVFQCTVTEGMTDGIYLGGINIPGTPSSVQVNENVLIDFCTITHCRRNNISVVAADGVTISNCIAAHAGQIQGTAPRAGIDVEPNKTRYGTSKNVVLLNNTVKDNAGTYGVTFGGSGTERAVVEGNTISGHTTGLNFNNNSDAPYNTDVRVLNNTIRNNSTGMRVVGENVDRISGNLFCDNQLIGLTLLTKTNGIQIQSNRFVRNGTYGISAGYPTTTPSPNNVAAIYMTDNLFQDNVDAETVGTAGGASVRLYVKDEHAVVVFNDNIQLSSDGAVNKMKGVFLNQPCIARANGNFAKNLLDNEHPHDGFGGVGNYSADALVPEM
jgi:hypothetical protein